ncbi:hypothetical protein BOV90_03335 [Solemya velum gill symbiont]|uniref:urease accessory protein UreH domain-containing protein n=1 Tax=Solemya velum gill symbiont TaxID=2340 RepID=UPI000998DD58|nr:sulfite exporter TauE/SafE family protein [Solemya velum gill symbiont]OOY40582.1 hypothetical protein BOV90_03335 [Solemya velum gill symbiont]
MLGLSVGFTTCTAVCLPFLGTWALGQGQGGAAAARDTAVFAAGKIAAYAVLGGAAGLVGEALLYWLKGDVGHWLIALTGMSRNQRLSPFSMGFALSFTPCAPLAALLAASASTGDLLVGAVYGTLFGLGAALTPLFIVIPLLGKLGLKLQQDKPWMGQWLLWMGGAVLILIGLRRLQLIF